MKRLATALLLLGCKTEPAKPLPMPASASVAPSASSASVLESLPPPPSTVVDAAPEAAAEVWEVLPSLDGLSGRWVGVDKGDAIPQGPTGGKIVEGGARFEFVEKRPGSVTPWNLTAWVPKEGHMGSDSISIGCGFYPTLHEEWRVAYCRGYGLPGLKSQEERLVLKKSGDKLQVQIGDLISIAVKRQ